MDFLSQHGETILYTSILFGIGGVLWFYLRKITGSATQLSQRDDTAFVHAVAGIQDQISKIKIEPGKDTDLSPVIQAIQSLEIPQASENQTGPAIKKIAGCPFNGFNQCAESECIAFVEKTRYCTLLRREIGK